MELNTIDGINSMLQIAERHISDLGGRILESNQAEQLRDQQILHNENRVRKHSDIMKCNNIHIVGIPEGK